MALQSIVLNIQFSRRGILALLSSLVLALSVGPVLAGDVHDALGRTVDPGKAQRIISLGPDVSEIVFALGGADRVVGRDRSSTYPAETTTKPEVGYRKSLSVEGLMALDPDLILASEDIGPPEAVDTLKSLSIPIVFVPEDNSAEGIANKITLIAEVLGKQAEGQKLSQSVLADFAEAAVLGSTIPDADRKKVVFFHGLLRLTGAGAHTSVNAIINLAGGANPLDIYDGYKSVSEERLLELQPDVVVMVSDGKGGPTPEAVFANPALANTPAGRNKALIILKGAYMIGFGPRTANAVRGLAEALYPR